MGSMSSPSLKTPKKFTLHSAEMNEAQRRVGHSKTKRNAVFIWPILRWQHTSTLPGTDYTIRKGPFSCLPMCIHNSIFSEPQKLMSLFIDVPIAPIPSLGLYITVPLHTTSSMNSALIFCCCCCCRIDLKDVLLSLVLVYAAKQERK